jgi:hypothetical protein
VFIDEAYSVRAACRTLQAKWLAGKRTLLAIFESYAPASDGNDPRGYAMFVARHLGLLPVQIDRPGALVIFGRGGTIESREQLECMLAAMARMECGAEYEIDKAKLSAGVELFASDFRASGEGKYVHELHERGRNPRMGRGDGGIDYDYDYEHEHEHEHEHDARGDRWHTRGSLRFGMRRIARCG